MPVNLRLVVSKTPPPPPQDLKRRLGPWIPTIMSVALGALVLIFGMPAMVKSQKQREARKAAMNHAARMTLQRQFPTIKVINAEAPSDGYEGDITYVVGSGQRCYAVITPSRGRYLIEATDISAACQIPSG